MFGRGGGGRRSDSRPDNSSPAPDQSVNRGGGGRGRGYGSPDVGGPRPAPEFNAPANFQPLSSPSPSAPTYAAALGREFDKSLTLQSLSSDRIRPQSQTLIPRQTQPQQQTPAPRPAQPHPIQTQSTTSVPSQPQASASLLGKSGLVFPQINKSYYSYE